MTKRSEIQLTVVAFLIVWVAAAFAWALWHRVPERADIQKHDGVYFFHGVRCKGDCSGHMAGYKWAAKHDIDDDEKCSGKSESFVEGCSLYVQEQWEADMERDRMEAAGTPR
jgi:hypothetical protein